MQAIEPLMGIRRQGQIREAMSAAVAAGATID